MVMKTILIADDSKLIREMLTETLVCRGYRVIEAQNGEEVVRLARTKKPDLIISDIEMPVMDGIEACRLLAKTPGTAAIPVIILTVRSSTADIKAGLEAHAVDYLTKPFDPDELAGRVNSALKIRELKDQVEFLKGRLKKISTTDDLTGLRNASYFWEHLNREIKRSASKKISLSLVVIDMDNFKTVNDAFGHPFGDEVLKEAARLLRATLGKRGLLARFGGEEFVAVLGGTKEEGAFAIAERLRKAIAGRGFSKDGTPFRLSISCGVATMRPDITDEHDDSISLFERADKALYEAKTRGKGITVAAPLAAPTGAKRKANAPGSPR
jgi:two-component system cell cycle response regulator